MGSDDRSESGAPLNTSGRASPGWLFVLPWSLRVIAGGGVNEVVKSLILQCRSEGSFTPQLLVSSEGLDLGATAGPDLIKPYRLNLWSPINRQYPFRGWFSFAYHLPYRCWALRRIIARHDIKIINAHFPGLECLLFVMLKKLRLFKGQLILSVHLSDVQDALATKGLERNLWKVLLRGADHIAAVSDDLAKDVLALDPTVAAKVTTIYNGVDLAMFAPEGNSREVPASAPIKGPTILSIGAFLPRKGHDVLVRAFARVGSEFPDARLFLVGQDGPEIDKLRGLVDELSLEERVFFHTDVSHECIPSFLAQAQLFVLASRKESFGLVVTEAAAAKVPVVCTRAEGIRELITDGVTGRLVDIDDPAALADAMIDALKRPDDSQRMAAAFYEQIRSTMTWQHAYAKYLRLSR